MEDVSQDDHVGVWEWICTEVARLEVQPLFEPERAHVLVEVPAKRGQVEVDEADVA
jgi:hypothetical protein